MSRAATALSAPSRANQRPARRLRGRGGCYRPESTQHDEPGVRECEALSRKSEHDGPEARHHRQCDAKTDQGRPRTKPARLSTSVNTKVPALVSQRSSL